MLNMLNMHHISCYTWAEEDATFFSSSEISYVGTQMSIAMDCPYLVFQLLHGWTY